MTKTSYCPDRRDIIWLDFEPTKGKEIGKYRPALVLSSKQFNQKTNLLMLCRISTSIRRTLTEVPIDCLDKPSTVVTSIIQTLSWKERQAKYITKISAETFQEVVARIIPLIGADVFFNR